jgi:mono/diheme cytochrome c family protein
VTAALVAATLGACGSSIGSSNQASSSGSDSGGSDASAGTSATGGSSASVGGSGAVSSGGAGSSDLPCEVQALLANKCLVCHRADPPGTLLTSADFQKKSKVDPARTVGQVAVERLGLTTNLRMPPAPLAAATDAEIAALSAWVQGGALPASCGQPVAVGPDPYDTPVVCTSMKNWTGGNRESPLMRPGGACISCHQQEGEGPLFAVAGTLFPTPHEPNDCNGVSSTAGAQVVITEANGTVHTLSVNGAGNFSLEARTFAFPYQAKVVYQGRERVMVEAQKSGDCNDCHTQDGRENAPGRIFLP